MTRDEMLTLSGERRGAARFGFGRTEAWRDYHGTHRRVDIWWGGEVVGRIEGESGNLWPYEVCDLSGKALSKHETMREAKAAARARWTS